jgi:hypothetical protein
MAHDPLLQAITEAEATIQARKPSREASQVQFREPAALELIADELTRLHAEVKTLRYLFATYAARAAGRP